MSQIFQRDMPLNEADPNNLLMHINRHLERIAGLSSLTIDDLKAAIMSDPVLKAALTGSTEQNYGGSILKNGALENNTLQGWNAGVIDEVFNGLKSLKTNSNVRNTNSFFIENTAIYKITCYIKVPTGNAYIELNCKDSDGVSAPKSNASVWAYPSNSVTNSSNYQKIVSYVGGAGNATSNFSPNCVRAEANLVVWNNSTNFVWLNSLVIEKNSLGEPVPFNLPYLPSGQMVFDPTDGSVGRYDGTTIHWFTME